MIATLAVVGGLVVVAALGFGGQRAWRWVRGVLRMP